MENYEDTKGPGTIFRSVFSRNDRIVTCFVLQVVKNYQVI